MSWQSLIKPPGKDPKNINEWLGLITDQIRELKQTENWYDISRVVMTTSIVDNLESHRTDTILSANQGRTLKELIDTLETKVDELVSGINDNILDINTKLEENIPKILQNIESISQLTTKVTQNTQSIESINATLQEQGTDITELESSLNILSDRVNKNNTSITDKVTKLETKVDEKVIEINSKITDIYSDTGLLVGGNEIISGLNASISDQNVITTTVGKAIINGNIIDVTNQLTITVTPELLNKDYILLLTLKLNEESGEPTLSLVESVSNNEVLIAKLSIVDGKINSNSKMDVLQPMNTMIGLAADNEAETVRETIPSGFTTLGELDYDYMLNNENVVKLKSESVAYVNGYKVVIPEDTIINIGKAPEKESREDLLFLEVWKDQDFAKTGKLKWRIRHVADVDFDTYVFEGFAKNNTNASWLGGNPNIQVQGGLAYPTNYWLGSVGATSWSTMAMRQGSGNKGVKLCLDDPCIFISGIGDTESKTLLQTLDGYVYAIPMFRLYRKPSCGKSIPFEYSKFNQKGDYKKFSNLVKCEKVERVISENIKGRSLSNNINVSKLPSSYTYNYITHIITTPIYDNSAWSSVPMSIYVNSNKVYSLILNILDDNVTVEIGSADSTVFYKYSALKIGKYVKTFQTTDITQLGIKAMDTLQTTNKRIQVMLLEGDWTDKEIPEFFTGLKSLGEDDGNLVVIKNGIVTDDTYDVNTGNQKLKTFSEATHIMASNVISPTVEANIVKGDSSTALEKLNSKLDTDGTETIEFTSIKGNTLQNIISLNNKEYTVGKNIDVNFIKPLKTEAWYTIIINITNNTMDKPVRFSGYQFCGGLGSLVTSDSSFSADINIMDAGKNGVWIGKVKITTFGTSITPLFTLFSHGATTGGYTATAMVLTGDYTNIPLSQLPFIDGIQSVGDENNLIDLSVVGKNLISKDMYTNNWFVGDSISIDRFDNTGKLYSIYGIKTFGLKPLTLSCNKSFNRMVFRGKDSNGNILYSGNLGSINKTIQVFNDIPDNVATLDLYIHSEGIDETYDFMLEVGNVATTYTPHESFKQKVYLKEPLRSLPDGDCDEIVGNKITRKTGKLVLNGSETGWKTEVDRDGTNTLYFEIPMTFGSRDFRCNLFNVKNYGDSASVWTMDEEIANYDDYWKMLVFRINRSKLSSPDLSGFKTWLKSNPVIIYYRLSNTVEEYLENVYEKESIKTYQLDAPLRSLPNGTKDEIKDGVLIRRCREYLVTGYENWIKDNVAFDTDTLITFYADTKISASLGTGKAISDKFIQYSIDSAPFECFNTYATGINLKLLKSKLSSLDVTGLQTWLKANPIKVLYELATPTETILTEAKPQTADFSLQRQFAEGNWLRELPNGVKDTVENGKVIRRTTKLTLNGSELWELHSNNTTDGGTLYRYFLPLNTTSAIGTKQDILICDKLKVVNDVRQEIWSCENIHYRIDSNRAGLYIVRNNITTLQDFKSWLTNNPVSIITLLATPTEEELTNENCNYFPVHDFNTYCGSMYVGEGMNYIINENKMSSDESIIVETDFREIEGNTRVEDCKYKKCDDGYTTSYVTSKSSNLLDTSIENRASYNTDVNYTPVENGFTVSNTSASTYANVSFKVFLKANVPYRIDYTKSSSQYGFVDLKTLSLSWIANLDSGTVFTVSESGYYYVMFYCTRNVSAISSATFTEVRLTEGSELVMHEPYVKTLNYLEILEENDIDDLRHQVSLTGFNYDQILNDSFDKLLRGEL